MDTATVVEKLDRAAEGQLQQIIQHGPRNFEEWLIKAESVTCSICKAANAKDCPLKELVQQHPAYRDWSFCVKCGGRQVAELADKKRIYDHSDPVMIVGGRGHPVPTKCDCEVADKLWPKTLPLAPEPFQSMCQLQRFLAFHAAMDKVNHRA